VKQKNIVAILAGGTGSRVGGDIPKQFLPLGGRMVIERTIDVFDQHPLIDAIVVVIHPAHLKEMHAIVGNNSWKKVAHIVPGGKERYHSSIAALDCCLYCDPDDKLLIHDAARPLLAQEVITRTIEELKNHDAVAVGVPSVDTVWHIDPSTKNIIDVPARSSLYMAQTPQAFRLSVIREAYRLAQQDPLLAATDDCGIIMRYMPHIPIHIVEGDPSNIKITYPQDILKINSQL